MRKLIPLLVLFSCYTSGCADERKIKALELSSPDRIISLQQLLNHQEEYKDKQVMIGAYFISHSEGAWISAKNGNSNDRFETMLAIKHNLSAKFDISDSNARRLAKNLKFDENDPSTSDRTFSVREVYHEFTEGLPAVIIGTFRVGDYSYPNGLNLENYPYIELIKVREIPESELKVRHADREPVDADNQITRP